MPRLQSNRLGIVVAVVGIVGLVVSVVYVQTTGSAMPAETAESRRAQEWLATHSAEALTPNADPSPPSVPKTVETRFTKAVPTGFRTFETGLNASPFAVRDGALSHGKPTAANAASYLEKRLGGDVQRIGARVRFGAGDSGAIALIAWRESLVDTRSDEGTLPKSGLHFVAYPGSWHLGAIDPDAEPLEDIIASGRYAAAGDKQDFDLYRDGDTVYVVDPSGFVTTVTDSRIAEWAGPFVNWELYEPTPGLAPASFLRVWAG